MTVVERDRPHDGPAHGETAILEAARDLLVNRGVDGLSMRQVAEQVGVSATAIYHYFSGKQDLVNRVVLRAFERFGRYLRDAMAQHPEGSIERIEALGYAYLRFALENQEYYRVMFHIHPEERDSLQALPDGGGYDLLRQAVVDAVAAGTIRGPRGCGDAELTPSQDAYPDTLAMYLWSTVHGLVTLALCGATDHCNVRGPASVFSLYEAFTPFIADGVMVPKRGNDAKQKESDQ
jgi:AcrR family transcriptional regulator